MMRLKDVKGKDLHRAGEGKTFEKAHEAGLSPTCIVPVAVMNAGWIENVLTSKNLALSRKELKIVLDG